MPSVEDKYLQYILSERRYSPRTASIYGEIIGRFRSYCNLEKDSDITGCLDTDHIRQYQVHLSRDQKLGARTIGLHLSVLSGFCKYLVRSGILSANPVRMVPRPKTPKRLPSFYREKSMDEYFERTGWDKTQYKRLLSRLVVSLLYGTGMRRSELISLRINSIDFGRNVIRVKGKGGKMREIPLISSLSQEISLYLQAVETLSGRSRSSDEPLLVSEKGSPLYPMAVERIVKAELGQVRSIAGRKSPHILRHTLATELLDKGADLNSIKELLGHSSLAATQVYTHNSIGKLKNVYNNAHPRAKRGGNNGD